MLDKLYRRRRSQVDQELHAISKFLAEGPWDIIVVGKPEKQSMVSKDPAKGEGNAKINRAVQNDWPLVKLLGRLSYKTHLRDRYVTSADERYTTQRCSRCGHRQKLDPSVRVYRCPKCGLVMGRDENSAVNLLNKILAELARPPVKPDGFTARAVYRHTPWGRWYTETSRVHNMALASGSLTASGCPPIHWGEEVTMGVSMAKMSGNPVVFIPLHKGADGWLSDKQFKTFYWPTLKKVIWGLVEEGMVPFLFAEGGYNTRLEVIAPDLPPGSTIWLFDDTDMARAKEILGKVACIAGNVPITLLTLGTPQEIKDYCRRLIETAGRDGGFILSSGAVIDDIRPENVRALIEAAKEYGRYA